MQTAGLGGRQIRGRYHEFGDHDEGGQSSRCPLPHLTAKTQLLFMAEEPVRLIQQQQGDDYREKPKQYSTANYSLMPSQEPESQIDGVMGARYHDEAEVRLMKSEKIPVGDLNILIRREVNKDDREMLKKKYERLGTIEFSGETSD